LAVGKKPPTLDLLVGLPAFKEENGWILHVNRCRTPGGEMKFVFATALLFMSSVMPALSDEVSAKDQSSVHQYRR
jgi:hypothetical protein